MKYLLLPFIIFTSFSAFSQYSVAPINTLRPFTTDGCSAVPDIGMTECCTMHDVAYWVGGTKRDRILSDIELRSCIKSKSNSLLGNFFYWGVRIGGTPGLQTSFSWGYGWKHSKAYGPLTQEELDQVTNLMPENPLEVPITRPINNLELVPMHFGSYCMDEIYEYVKNTYNDQSIRVEKVRKTDDYYRTKLFVKMNNGVKLTFLYSNKNWNKCHIPLFDEIIPVFYSKVSIR